MEHVDPAATREKAKGRQRGELSPAEAAVGIPYSFEEIATAEGSIAGHLPILYALALGCGAGTMVDLGIGSTTRTLLRVAHDNRGRLYSCDYDRRRYAKLLTLYPPSKRWRLSLCASSDFLPGLPAGLNFVSHDGAHDEDTVRADLDILIPKMKRFAIITLHDTQHSELGPGMYRAVQDVRRRYPVTSVTLPFHCGLTILRIEESEHPPIVPASTMKRGQIMTVPFSTL